MNARQALSLPDRTLAPLTRSSRAAFALGSLLVAGVLACGDGNRVSPTAPAHSTDVAPVAAADVSVASCVTPPEQGTWVNANPYTNSVTRVALRFVCQDQVLNGQPYPPGPAWYMRLFGKCYPTDCDWGTVGARRLSNGQVFGVYYQGFATRYVWAAMSQYRPGQLWVFVRTDFTDPSRADYDTQNWFVRQ
jgi:hypothetical protein